MALGRGFQEISVIRLGCQTPAERFGALPTPHTPPVDDSDSEDDQEVDDTHTVPRIEEWKMNLTVLSQYHNLYFVAYGDQIYVYRPLGSQQALPPEPALVIEPPQSPEARRNNRLLSRYHAHVINHLVVGEIGNKEILLCSCHDGDVFAYYTDTIENALQNSLVGYSSIIKPFFEENVGNSAWGLAIHQQSRLIAVGSNSHEVQVFAFGLTISAHERLVSPPDRRRTSAISFGAVRFPVMKQVELTRNLDGRIVRDQNFKLVLKLKAVGHNIPSIAFSDNIYGDAETIIAKDIKGALWIFSLWEDKWKRLPTVPEEPDPHTNPMGWGVIVLPRNIFKPTHNAVETYGCPESWACRNGKIDISKSIQLVRDSTVWHEIYDTDDYADNDDVDYLETDEEMDAPLSETGTTAGSFRGEQDYVMYDPEEMSADTTSVTQQPLTVARSTTPPPQESLPMSSEGIGPVITIITADRSISHLITSGSLILHSNRYSIFLLPTFDLCPPTQCHNALHQEFPHDLSFPRPLTDYDRLNMLATIPELSLVLVASQIGRVALITITRTVDRYTRLTPTVSMRVDLILPFAHEESEEKIRPSHGLLGMAVGPMQGERARMAVKGTGPRRWRLMLHYFNHAILSYEISRDEETEELLVL